MTNPTNPAHPTTIRETTYLDVYVNLARMDEMGRLMGWEAFGFFHFDVLGVARWTDYCAELDSNQPVSPSTHRLVFKVTSTPPRPRSQGDPMPRTYTTSNIETSCLNCPDGIHVGDAVVVDPVYEKPGMAYEPPMVHDRCEMGEPYDPDTTHTLDGGW